MLHISSQTMSHTAEFFRTQPEITQRRAQSVKKASCLGFLLASALSFSNQKTFTPRLGNESTLSFSSMVS